MKEISAVGKARLEYKLEAIVEELKGIGERLEEARAQGDLSENADYDASLAEFTRRSQEKIELEGILLTAKVRNSYSSSIGIGTLLSIKIEEQDGSTDDLGLVLFDETGSGYFDNTVSVASNLGRVIQGGTSGVYIVQDLMGVDRKYTVEIQPQSRIEEYLEKNPPNRQVTIDRMFAGIE